MKISVKSVFLVVSMFAFLFFSGNAYADTWSKTYGGSLADSAQLIQQVSDSGYIILGNTNSFGSTWGGNVWLLRVDTSGNILWQKAYGGDWHEYSNTMQQTSDGGYIVASYTSSFSPAFYSDTLVLKLDADGNIQWQKVYKGGSYTDDGVSSIYQTSDGGYIMGGVYSADYGRTAVSWAVKLDSGGNIQWQKTYRNLHLNNIVSIHQTSDGGYIAGGVSTTFYGDRHYEWVVKLDSDGNVQWQKTYDININSSLRTFSQTVDGGFIMAGDATLSGASHDIWAIKLDASGNIEWQKTYVSGGSDVVYSIQQTTDSGYMVSASAADMLPWVFKLDSGGNIQWQKKYKGNLIIRGAAHSVQETKDGGYITGGWVLYSGRVGSNMWAAKLDGNGNMSGCEDFVENTNAIASDINVSVNAIMPGVTNAAAFIQTSNAIVTDTNVIPSVICTVSNQPPVANAGADQTVSCSGPNGAAVTLDGSGSSDPDGDALAYTWTGIFGTATGMSPTVQVPFGTNSITLKVDDGKGGTSEDAVLVTVNDNAPPLTTATVTGTSGNNGWYVSDVGVSLIATDNCAGVKEIHYSIDGAETVVTGSSASVTITTDGTHSFTYYAVDNAGNIETAHPLTINIDKTPPVLNVTVTPGLLWPPNHKMVLVTPSINVSDNLTGNVQTEIVSVTSSEPDNGLGDGDTANDIVINPDGTIFLRAERAGSGNGRIYTITMLATDNAGNRTVAVTEAIVPHDKGR